MEKDILIQELRKRVGENNASAISDQTFDSIAESVLAAFVDDTKITEDTWKLPVTALNNFAGQKRADDKRFTERYKAEYESQHQKDVEARIQAAVDKALDDFKKSQGGERKNEGGEGIDIDKKIDDKFEAFLERLTGEDGAIGKLNKGFTDFTSTFAQQQKNAVISGVKERLKAHLKALKADNEACIDDALDTIDYGDTPTFDGLKQTAIDAYEKRYKRYYGDGGKPFGGKSADGGGDNKSFVSDKLAKLRAENEANANYSQEIEKSFM